jgi:hypothetical protein
MLVILACSFRWEWTQSEPSGEERPTMPDIGKTQRTYESLGLAARAESEMQPPVELRTAQPLETIVDPL